jgi:hypothetical protein
MASATGFPAKVELKKVESRRQVRHACVQIGLLMVAVAVLCLASSANAGTVAITGSMEGNLLIKPGDTVKAGYDVMMPGTYPLAHVNVTGLVILDVVCPDNSQRILLIILPSRTYDVAKNSNAWVPTADQNNSAGYQGSTVAPDLCGHNKSYHAPRALFAAIVFSSDNCDLLNVRFHYSDHSPGAWSSSSCGICPKHCISPPCKCD